MTTAAIGIGSNVGDAPSNVLRALTELSRAGRVVRRSRLYRSKPWGYVDQSDFCNAAALLETQLPPRDLLKVLKTIESEFGRVTGERWGPRVLDLDILLYDGAAVEEPDLRIPHPRLYERAFALIPLAEVDPSQQPALEALSASEVAGVVPLEESEPVALMSEEALLERVQSLVLAFVETDLVRLRILEPNEDSIELRKPASAPARRAPAVEPAEPATADERLEPIKADLVGIFHFTRPIVREGEKLNGDRELAHVEALGIRNPVRSLGAGQVAKVRCKEGQPVEYGQVLFEIDRG